MSVPVTSHLERLPLDSLFNTRDLGGIPIANGGFTAFGRFLRSDETAKLSDADLVRLIDYPVKLVIDLRTPSEIRQLPSRLAHVEGIRYANVSLMGDDLDEGIAAIEIYKPGRTESTLGDFYIHMLKHSGREIGRVFSIMAEQQDGAMLFHCAHGKDRTGLIAALLLKLAGASDDDIIENYAISFRLLLPWFETFWDQVPDRVRPFLNTDRENMEETLAFFNSHYASVSQYLAIQDVPEQTVERIRQMLIGA